MRGKARLRGLSQTNLDIRADPSYPCRSVFYSSFQGEARLRGLSQTNLDIRADPSYPCRSVFYSSFQGEARLRRWCESNGVQAKSRITASGAKV